MVVFRKWTKERFENPKHLREGLCKKCNIWLLVNNNLGLANALRYHASRRVYGLWIMLLFHLFFGTTSLETESRNRLLVYNLLAGGATFVLLRCISYIWGFLKIYLFIVLSACLFIFITFFFFRLKESGAINSSLFALSQVVDALNQGLV